MLNFFNYEFSLYKLEIYLRINLTLYIVLQYATLHTAIQVSYQYFKKIYYTLKNTNIVHDIEAKCGTLHTL